jgi:hypothetical protein
LPALSEGKVVTIRYHPLEGHLALQCKRKGDDGHAQAIA